MSDLVSKDALDFLGGDVDPSMLFGFKDAASDPVTDDGLDIADTNADVVGLGNDAAEDIDTFNTLNSGIIDLTASDDDIHLPQDTGYFFDDDQTKAGKTFGSVDLAAGVNMNDFEHNQDNDTIVEQGEDPLEDSPLGLEIAEYLANYGQDEAPLDADTFGGIDLFQSIPEPPSSKATKAENLSGAVLYGIDGNNSSPEFLKENANTSYGVPFPGDNKSEIPNPPVKKPDSPRDTLKDIIQHVGGLESFQERYKAWRCCEKRPLSDNELSTFNVLAQHDLGTFVRSLGAFVELDQLQLAAAASLTSERPVVKGKRPAVKRSSISSVAAGIATGGSTLELSGTRQSAISSENQLPRSGVVTFKEHDPFGDGSYISAQTSAAAQPHGDRVLEQDPQYRQYVHRWMTHPEGHPPARPGPQVQPSYAPQHGFLAQGYRVPSNTTQSVFFNDNTQVPLSNIPKTRSPSKASLQKAAIQAPKPMHPNAVAMFEYFGQNVPESRSASTEQAIKGQSGVKQKVSPKPRCRSKSDIQAAKLASTNASNAVPVGNAGSMQPQPFMPHNQVMFHIQSMYRVIHEQKQIIEQQQSLIKSQGLAITQFVAAQGHVGYPQADYPSGLAEAGSSAGIYTTDNLGLQRKRSADGFESDVADKRCRSGPAAYDAGITSGSAMVPGNDPAGLAPFPRQNAFSVVDRQQDFNGNFTSMNIMREETPCPAPRIQSRKVRPTPARPLAMNATSNMGSNSSSSGGSNYVPS